MNKVILLLGIIGILLINGCVSNSHEDKLLKYIQEEDAKLDAKHKQMEEEWDLRDSMNISCVIYGCLDFCDMNLTINMMDYDYNRDGEVDDFEYEVMQSAIDRDKECLYNCHSDDYGKWRYMEECKGETE